MFQFWCADASSAPPAGTHPRAAKRSTAAVTEDSAERQRKHASLPAAGVAARHVGSHDRVLSQPQAHQPHQAAAAAAAAVTEPLQPQHIRNDGAATKETASRARKRKRHREDTHAGTDTALPPASTADVSVPTAKPTDSQGGTVLEAAAARKLLKRQRKVAAAAGATTLPAGSPVADQPGNKAESSRRRPEAAGITSGGPHTSHC